MKQIQNYPSQRVGIFIDVVNLYHSAKNLYHGRVNYSELMKTLIAGRQFVRAMAYVVKSEGVIDPHQYNNRKNKNNYSNQPSSSSSEGAFFEALEKSGLELRVKDLQIFVDGTKKGDWDVGMTVDAIRQSSSLDVVVLVTGDGDFVPLIEYLRFGAGKIVEVAAFGRSASQKLQEAADRFINIEEIPRIIIKH
jgi:uncharacterized LabA/DUF88 family protein